MYKRIILYICILSLFSSCYFFIDGEERERVQVVNQTEENVLIFKNRRLIFGGNSVSRVTRIFPDETRSISVIPGVEYFAEGESTGREFGRRVFQVIPSGWDVQQTWTIRE
ncbi:MAG: hypothetical protein FWC65_01065 [Treponema sp.]|nr:hypothetical protein [Treponema sp.]